MKPAKPLSLILATILTMIVGMTAITIQHATELQAQTIVETAELPPPLTKVFPDGSSVTCVVLTGGEDALLVWRDAAGEEQWVDGPVPLPEVPR